MEVFVELPSDDGYLGQRLLLTALLVAITAGAALDLALDMPKEPGAVHIAFEAALVVLSLSAVAYLWIGWTRTRRSLAQAREVSDTYRNERDAWQSRSEKLLRGLGEEIDSQLRGWRLTPAEREIALMLLKGYGHKEIAALLGRSERTIRQHAVAVYRKSGLSGRAELSAFFLEDLLLPSSNTPEASGHAES
jgi:DNA-binding CsgD family transcriptional regulator